MLAGGTSRRIFGAVAGTHGPRIRAETGGSEPGLGHVVSWMFNNI